MTKRVFTANYNGEAIKPGEVMVPFEYTELDAECNCTNSECIKTVTQGGKTFKVIYKAVPEAYAKAATSALNLIQNEELGHYAVPNSVSYEGLLDEYDLDLAASQSAEDDALEGEELSETIQIFEEKMLSLISQSPKMGFAFLLTYTGVKGDAFYDRMKLKRAAANRIQQEVEEILKAGLLNFDIAGLNCYKSPFNDIYKEEALKLLKEVISQLR